jgi:predicted  nucleic acid-binding Zn-ribbon protein
MSIIDNLLALQNHDAIIRGLQQQINDIPVRIDQEKHLETRAHEELIRVTDQIATLQTHIDELEARFEETSATIESLNNDLEEANSSRVAAIEETIGYKKRDLISIESNIAHAKENLALAEQARANSQKKYADASASVKAYIESINKKTEEVQALLTEAEAKRSTMLEVFQTPVEKRYLAYYERFSKRRWPVLAHISSNSVCEGCHMALPQAKQQAVRKAEGIVTCDYCGRIVY